MHRDKVALKQTSPLHQEQRLRMGKVLPPLPHTSPSQETDIFAFVIYIINDIPYIMRLPLIGCAVILFYMGPSLVPEFLYITQYSDHHNTRIYALWGLQSLQFCVFLFTFVNFKDLSQNNNNNKVMIHSFKIINRNGASTERGNNLLKSKKTEKSIL
jgi:Na+/proline symporter